MPFQLQEVVPWGRSYDEYVAMFAMTDEELTRPILGCGDGPASFNAVLTRRGGTVRSVDPLYAFSASDIRARIDEVAPIVVEQARQSADEFVWGHIHSIEHLQQVRLEAMDVFLADFADEKARERYDTGGLPVLPYANDRFSLAVCSHLLFLYSSIHSEQFHLDSIMELCRVASEARIFPLLELGGTVSRHLQPVCAALGERGYRVAVTRVAYEFQRGGNQMLSVRKPCQ
jgi:hypothetical protein